MRAAAVLSAVLLLGALVLVAAGMSAPPLDRTCDPQIDQRLCGATVDAALERGLGTLHPLILSSHVAPGADAAPGLLGHKATVTFTLLGIPGPTEVRMFTDIGGHWGGAVDRSDAEVAFWTLAPVVVAGLLVMVLSALAWRRRHATS